jgi:hypothetical protein
MQVHKSAYSEFSLSILLFYLMTTDNMHNMIDAIFWNITLCSPYVNQRFGGKYFIHFQDRKSAEQETGVLAGDTFLRNAFSCTDCMMLCSRRW